MAFRTQDHTDLTKFGNRLWKLMEVSGIDTAKKLATKLYDSGYNLADQRESFDYESKIRNNAIGSMERIIKEHIKADTTEKLQGKYVDAYCKFFSCSADYLFGNIDCKTHDNQFIHNQTGLSETAIGELEQLNAETAVYEDRQYDLDTINTLISQLNHRNNSIIHWITTYMRSKGLERDIWYYTESGAILFKKHNSTEPVIHMEEKSDTFDNLILMGLQNRIKALKPKTPK